MKISGARNNNKSIGKFNRFRNNTNNIIIRSVNNDAIKVVIKDVIIYCRVSTPDQEMDAQEYSCVQYCNDMGYTIKDIVIETGSAYKERKENKLEDIIKNNSNVIILVNRVDRFSRNLVICDRYLKTMKTNNILLKSVNDFIDLSSPIGRHTFRNLISQSQLESEIIGERVKNSIKYRVENDIYIGTPKFGYKNENKVKVQDKYEQAIITFIANNLYKTKTADVFSKDLFKILDTCGKPDDFYVNVEFANENDEDDEEEITSAFITTLSISNVLNEYELFKRGKEWNQSKVRILYNSILNNLDNLAI